MNKNGWGLRAELGFLLLFLVCLLITTIGLHRMGLVGNKDDNVEEDFGEYTIDPYDYDMLESRVSSAAENYYKDNFTFGGDVTIIKVTTLKNNGYLTTIYDSRKNECRGYAKVINGTAFPYIRCSTYKTAGYSEEYE